MTYMTYSGTRERHVLSVLGVLLGFAGLGCDGGVSGDGRTEATGAGDSVATAEGDSVATAEDVERGPRTQPGTRMGIYAPEQHVLYDGRFIIEGTRIYQAGTLTDTVPWDHMDDDASHLRTVEGRALIDVNELENTGTFRAEMDLPEGRYVLELEEFRESSPCQDGGVAAYIFEHGDSGCGDTNWPKSLLYVAGWGMGDATLNDSTLYEDYEIHFMVTQGMRDRETLRVADSLPDTEAGWVNPAVMQMDFYIRSPQENSANHPPREVFDHFIATEVLWR